MKTNIKNIILLAIRLYVGYVLVTKGFGKVMNIEGTVGFINKMTGLSAPFGWAVAWGELLAGLGLIFGAWTRVAAGGVIIIITGVLYYAGDMKAIPLLVGAIILVIFGGGQWAITNYIFKRKDKVIVASSANSESPKF